MDKHTLAAEIFKWQKHLIELAASKKNILQDPDVYRCSCLIDKLIVQYMKIKN